MSTKSKAAAAEEKKPITLSSEHVSEYAEYAEYAVTGGRKYI